MKCFFCNNPLATSYCENKICHPYYVSYIFGGAYSNKPKEKLKQSNLAKIQLKVHLFKNNKEYYINYHVASKDLEIVEQITNTVFAENASSTYWFFKTELITSETVLITKYNSLIITPTNAQDKLPTLLLFS